MEITKTPTWVFERIVITGWWQEGTWGGFVCLFVYILGWFRGVNINVGTLGKETAPSIGKKNSLLLQHMCLTTFCS